MTLRQGPPSGTWGLNLGKRNYSRAWVIKGYNGTAGHGRNVLGNTGRDEGEYPEPILMAEGPDPFPSSGSIAWKSFWTFTEGVTLEADVWNIIRRLRGQIIFRAAEVSLGTRSGPSRGEADGNMAGAVQGRVLWDRTRLIRARGPSSGAADIQTLYQHEEPPVLLLMLPHYLSDFNMSKKCVDIKEKMVSPFTTLTTIKGKEET
eukprot:g32629.t1